MKLENKKQNKFLFLLILILSISMCSAGLGSFEKNECVDIKTILNSSSANISSISYPNLTTAISNKEMTKNGKTFNYTFCETEDLGKYIYDYFDDEGNVYVNDFIITPDGNLIDTGESMMYIWILIFLIVLLAGGIFISAITPYENISESSRHGKIVLRVTKTKYVKIIAMWFSYGIFALVITVMSGMTNNYIQFEPMKGIFTSMYLFFNILGYGVSLTAVVVIIWSVWKDIILNKTILREGKALLSDL